MKKAIFFAMALTVSAGFLGCSKAPENTSTSTTTTTTTTTKEEAKPAAPAAPAAAPAGDKIGVPECDEYIEKYQKCITSKVPEMARGQLKSAFDQAISAWKQAAATPEGKQGLSMGCKMALDSAKQSTAAFGCEW
ncbi:MAG: hypothetical protein U1F57_00535 [bacterium]